MKTFVTLVSFLSILNFGAALFDLPENTNCPSHVSGQDGICLQATKCEAFKTERNKLGICSFNGRIPIICCPKQQLSSMKVLDMEKRRISSLKCEEYTKPKSSERFNPLEHFRQHDVSFIVGGIKAVFEEFPHMSAIGIRRPNNKTDWLCGGSLISDRFVLSAAHCATFGGKKPNVIRIGDQDLNFIEFQIIPQEFGIENIIIHPQYKTNLKYHDLALFKLNTSAKFTKDVTPACLYQGSDDPKIVEVMGYGQTSFGGPQANTLLKGFLNTANKSQCNQAYEDNVSELPHGITSSQICAWDPKGHRDTCQGDSGGPLQITKYYISPSKKYYEIVGVTSFGISCAAGVPGVYARVYSYLDWIESIVWK